MPAVDSEMTNIPHPPGHDDAFAIARKARAESSEAGGSPLDNDHAMCSAYLAHMRPQIEREVMQALLDPMVVHRNMLAGTIAKLNVNDVRHLYPEIERAAAEAMREACAELVAKHDLMIDDDEIQVVNGVLTVECHFASDIIRALPLPAGAISGDQT